MSEALPSCASEAAAHWYAHFNNLPFVTLAPDGEIEDCWDISTTGNDSVDCALGAMLGYRAAGYILETKSTAFLGDIVQAMVKHGRCGEPELSFLGSFCNGLLGIGPV